MEEKVAAVRAAWEMPRNDFVVWSVANQLRTKKWDEAQKFRFIIKVLVVMSFASLAILYH